MESRRNSASGGTEKRSVEKKDKVSEGMKKLKESLSKEGTLPKKQYGRVSMIPKLKVERNDTKKFRSKQKETTTTSHVTQLDTDKKLKTIAARERSVTEYYNQIEELIKKMLSQKEKSKEDEEEKEVKTSKAREKNINLSSTRKVTSDPLVFNNSKNKKDTLVDFEYDLKQISDIWLRTSSDLSKTLKNLKNNPSMDPIEFEVESVRILLAIKQAKSLTLVKTRNVIAEAKKLMNHRESIRAELEKLLSSENLVDTSKKCECWKEKHNQHIKERGSIELGGEGDPNCCLPERSKNIDDLLKGEQGIWDENSPPNIKSLESYFTASEKNSENMEKLSDKTNSGSHLAFQQEDSEKELSNLAAKLTKKNEIIANLNNKIFDLQKTCSECTVKYNQLQVKLFEFHEKIQWNQILWKQIGKLKERIKGLQLNNKELESQKKELESKISNLDVELDRIVKINNILNQKNFSVELQEKPRELNVNDVDCDIVEKVLAQKENIVEQLQNILLLMKKQENAAQKQIMKFQSKIEELTKSKKI